MYLESKDPPLLDPLNNEIIENMVNGAAWASSLAKIIKFENAYTHLLSSGRIKRGKIKDNLSKTEFKKNIWKKIKDHFNSKNGKRSPPKKRKTDHRSSSKTSSVNIYNPKTTNNDSDDYDSSSDSSSSGSSSSDGPDNSRLNNTTDSDNKSNSDSDTDNNNKKITISGKFNDKYRIRKYKSDKSLFKKLCKLCLNDILKVYDAGIFINKAKNLALNNINHVKDNSYYYSGEDFKKFIKDDLDEVKTYSTILKILPLIKFKASTDYWSSPKVYSKLGLALHNLTRNKLPNIFKKLENDDISKNEIGFNINNAKVKFIYFIVVPFEFYNYFFLPTSVNWYTEFYPLS